MFFSFVIAKAQSPECGVTIPPDVFKAFIDELPAIDSFKSAHANQTQTMTDVPLRFTAIQYQGGGSGFQFGNAEADATINYLNPHYAAAGIHFVRCGDVNKIEDLRIKTNEDVDQFITSFSYTSGAVEVYLKAYVSPSNGPATAVIPINAYFDVNPNWNFLYPRHNNWIRLRGTGDLGSLFAHELGHHFGLFHTHENASVNYHVPDPMNDQFQLDFPYPMPTLPDVDPGWWGRELVIREDVANDPIRPFKEKNYNRTGDLIGDTPPDCSHLSPNIWPGCPLSAQSFATCALNSSLTYTDYNGDPINPPPAGLSLGRNFMSYWNQSCLNDFTDEQYNRLSFYNTVHRQPYYTTNRCGTFTDKVEFEGSAIPLHNVTLRVRHPLMNNKCNVTSSLTGDYSGMLHIDWMMVHAYHNGKKDQLEFANNALKKHYGHKKCEWERGVTADDLTLISQHIMNNQTLSNGYRLIAADANQDNSITVGDVHELRKMILWDNYYIPGLEQPWRFIPEHVPQHNSAAFNQNPFALLGGAYLQQGWLYEAPAMGQRGFDGIKIGDVNSSWPNEEAVCDGQEPGGPTSPGSLPSFAVPSESLQQGEGLKLAFKVQNFQQINAFQIGLNLPFELFEVQDVVDMNLPSYTKEDYFGLEDLESHVFKTLWYSETGVPVSLADSTTLFSIVVKAKQDIPNLQAVLTLDNAVLPNFFHGNPSSPTAISVDLEPVGGERKAADANMQSLTFNLRCEPNPFTGTPTLKFTNGNAAGFARITVVNHLGLQALNWEGEIGAGENTVALPALAQLPQGAYWLRLELGERTSSLKIVKN